MSELTPGPDHAAPATGILATLPGRTVVQGIAVDVLLAICLVVYTTISENGLNWALIWTLIVKTVLMTVASSVMKRVKPPPESAVH
jgi:uncharacterized membrane protein YvlD (DUF360 family)